MARGVILPSQTSTQTLLFAIPKIPLTTWKLPFMSRQVSCKCLSTQAPVVAVDMAKYKEAFSRRMAMAGLKPHHRVAIGVSGGPDSMALCVLTAHWKARDFDAKCDSGGFIDGLLAIIVDHGLRAESKEEANTVSNRVSKLGIRSHIACCDWPDGHPKQGHLQEAARDMRYEIFQKICIQNRIGVLLIAHHADDQAELFVLRLSRNSGVLGLAGMPFTSQIFSTHTHSYAEVSGNYGILVVRPLLDLSKEDMYEICEGSNQVWVEDPTNQSLLYARNRIRMSLRDLSSSAFKLELQAVISACRKTRIYIDYICSNLISKAVTVMDLGYAVIDLEILNESKIEDICLSKFIALVLKFISQRHRPIRGSTSKLLLDYMHTLPCKTSLTAAGCYLSPAPGSRGMKALVCSSVDCPLPSKMESSHLHFQAEQENCTSDEIGKIIADGKSYADSLITDASDVHFLEGTSESVLTGARNLGMLSESTLSNILLLQKEEIQNFKSKSKVAADYKSEHGVKSVSTSRSEPLHPGQICCFMNRFFVTWKLSEEVTENATSEEANSDGVLKGQSRGCCRSCVFGHDMMVEVRNLTEPDWLYLANLSRSRTSENFQEWRHSLDSKVEQTEEKTNECPDYARLSAQRALVSLKSIPLAARRGLPVLVNSQGLLLSIPSIGFKHCPCLMVSATFKPKVPLGGGHSSFI
ncbi:PREDICTED: tRNA lysidine(34) synthetase TilS [Prunus dulcis]|uniref:tRNA(Ile)-lysidine synthetase n=1 Tax=Prunus dulcis TaxID=3755 RepID=A0A5E4E5D5_PRUDU|nr:uncharacterized protein LOC117634412 isoform X1 [Prunus dulcis]KAI5320477.1 hypothetical protein L3X38_040185 [Prunus dulcis]VVA10622.1 PREDICTED: tRNA lysidine(34) synthetase TilS [Prunus dulcis]